MADRRRRRLLQRFLSGSKNIRFTEAVACAEACGFRLSRISGSHHTYVHADIPELVNLQNIKRKAKPYQVKQLLRLIERYNLHMEEDPRGTTILTCFTVRMTKAILPTFLT